MTAPAQGHLPGMYSTISLDPPWLERGGGKSVRGAQRHYPLMPTPKIISTVLASEPVSRLAPDAHCWCWVTDNFLRDGLALMDALGFRYIRTLVWAKTVSEKQLRAWMKEVEHEVDTRLGVLEAVQDVLTIGLGQYLRGAHELALLGVRGAAMVPATADRMPSVVFAPKGRHSAKPDAAIEVFERCSPGPRVEMFSRTPRPGWDAWGNEAGTAPGSETTT